MYAFLFFKKTNKNILKIYIIKYKKKLFKFPRYLYCTTGVKHGWLFNCERSYPILNDFIDYREFLLTIFFT